MTTPTPGLHHVTCIASDPQRTVDFWVDTLGLRLVKRSVNQDDPSAYHLFFADTEGTPGTSMTFFAWPDPPTGRVGTGQVTRTAFRVPEGSLDFWTERFEEHGVDYDDRIERFGRLVLPFRDPDGLPLELVAVDVPAEDPTDPWTESVPETRAIRGFHGVALAPSEPEATAGVLETMGLERAGTETATGGGGERTRFTAAAPVGGVVDIVPAAESGRQGRGTVHHVAFRTPTDEDQGAMREAVERAGLRPTERIDRHWFQSVYFREPGGILFELATDGPGYTSDEPRSELGERLVLPGDFERRRAAIEAALPALSVPRGGADD